MMIRLLVFNNHKFFDFHIIQLLLHLDIESSGKKIMKMNAVEAKTYLKLKNSIITHRIKEEEKNHRKNIHKMKLR